MKSLATFTLLLFTHSVLASAPSLFNADFELPASAIALFDKEDLAAAHSHAVEDSDLTPASVEDYQNFVTYSQFSAAASCRDLSAWNCSACQHPAAVGTVVTKQIVIQEKAHYSYIAHNPNLKSIIVSFLGTIDNTGWLQDFKFLKKWMFAEWGWGVKVHDGWWQTWSAGKDIIHEEVGRLMEMFPGYTIQVTGLSLGGAVASLAAFDLALRNPTAQVHLTTYGQPRVGNSHYSARLSSLPNLLSRRLVHSTDPVPHLPPEWFDYRHHDLEYWVPRSDKGDVVRCSGGGRDDRSCMRSVIPDFNLKQHVWMPEVRWGCGSGGEFSQKQA